MNPLLMTCSSVCHSPVRPSVQLQQQFPLHVIIILSQTCHEELYVCFTKRLVDVSDYTELICYSVLVQV